MKENSIHTISAKRISQVLYERGWNKSELARRIGLSAQAVQQWAAGETKPSGKNLTKLAQATGKPEHWFFMESTENKEIIDSAHSTSDTSNLSEQHQRLIRLFDKMPESEKKQIIHLLEEKEKEYVIRLFEEKVKEYDRLLNDLMHLKNKKT